MGSAVARLQDAAFDPRAWGLAVVLLGAYAVPFLVAPGGNGPLEVISTAVMLPYYVSIAVPILVVGGAAAFWIGFVLYCVLLAMSAVALTDWLRMRLGRRSTGTR